MAIQLSHKKANYGGFHLHYIYYKNLNITDLGELCDQVSGLIYHEKISLISHTISANIKLTKNYLKAEKLTFGDVNWPEIWLHNKNNEQVISGYYCGISGSTVKTLAADNFISKIVESEGARYCFVGEIRDLKTKNNFEKQTDSLIQTQAKALLISGIELSNIVQEWYYSSMAQEFKTIYSKLTEDSRDSTIAIVGTINQHKSAVQNTFWAIKPNSKRVNVEHITYTKSTSKIKAVFINSDSFGSLLVGPNNGNENEEIFKTDITTQINEALNAIEKLLLAKSFEWKNMIRGIAYFKSIKDQKLFKQICKERKIPASPIMVTETDFRIDHTSFDFEADFFMEK